MSIPSNDWVLQPSKSGKDDMAGGATRTLVYLAEKDRGLQTAAEKGFVTGQQTVIDGRVYELAGVSVDDEGGGAHDRVTLTYQGIHGPAAPSYQKKRLPGAEEWRLRANVEVMTGQEALDQGWVASGSDLPDGDLDRSITVVKPVMERRRWIRGASNTKALPSTYAAALTKYMPYIALIGRPAATGSKWSCSDITSEPDGELLVIVETYEWRPLGWPLLVMPT